MKPGVGDPANAKADLNLIMTGSSGFQAGAQPGAEGGRGLVLLLTSICAMNGDCCTKYGTIHNRPHHAPAPVCQPTKT